MSGANGITGNINISTTGQAEATRMLDVLKQYIPVLNTLVPALGRLDVMETKTAAGISRTLGVYTRAATLAGAYAAAISKTAEAEQHQIDMSAAMATAINKTGTALATVQGITVKDYNAKSRQISLSQQLAEVTLAEAKAKGVLARAELDVAKAQEAGAKAKNLVSGAPLSAYQQANLALRAQAAATKTVSDAQAKGEQQARAMAAATEKAAAASEKAAAAASKEALAYHQAEANRAAKMLGAETDKANQAAAAVAKLAAEEQKLADAEAKAATRAAEQAAAEEKKNGVLRGSYFALYQVAAAYALVAHAAETVLTAPISAAASYEQAFNRVIISTDLLQETTVNAAGKAALLRSQMEQMATDMPVSFESLSAIAALGGQLGVNTENIKSFTETVGKYSAVTGVTAENAAMAFGRITNLLQVQVGEYPQLASAIAELGTKSAATATEVQNVVVAISAASHGAGLSTQDVLGLGTAMASLQITPFLARGTVTRIFNDIDKAAADSKDGLTEFAKVMSISVGEAENLQRTNPMDFFQQLIKGIHDSVQNGTALTTVLSNLGLKNASDINVVQRLANNYGLLANSVRGAYSAFDKQPDGKNFLDQAADKLFGSLTAKATEFGNTLQNVLANAGSSGLAPLSALLTGATDLLKMLNNIPASVSLGVAALAAMISIWAVYKFAMATSIAVTLAFKNALGGMSAGNVRASASAGTLIRALRQTVGATSEAAAATTTIVGANDTVIASNQALAVSAEATAAKEIAAAEAAAAARKAAAMTSLGLAPTSAFAAGGVARQAGNAAAASANAAASARMAASASVAAGAEARLAGTVGYTNAAIAAQTVQLEAAIAAFNANSTSENLLVVRNNQLALAAERTTAALAGNAVESNSAAAALLRLNAAEQQVAAAKLRTIELTEIETAALRGNAAAAGANAAGSGAAAAGTVALGGAAAATTPLLTRMGLALKGLSVGSWIGIGLTALVTGYAVLQGVFQSNKDSAEKLAQEQEKLQHAFLDGVGGAEALTGALDADTKAGASADGAYRQLTRTFKDNHDGTATLITAWQTLGANGKVLSSVTDDSATSTVKYADSQVSAANAAAGHNVQQDALGRRIGLTTDQIKTQTTVLGEHTAKLAADALTAQIAGDVNGKNATGGDAILTAKDLADAKASGINIAEAFAAGIKGGGAGIAAAFKPRLDQLHLDLAAEQAKLTALAAKADAEAQASGTPSVASKVELEQRRQNIKAIEDEIARFQQLPGVVDAANGSIQRATDLDKLHGDILKAVGADAGEMGTEVEGAGGAVEGTGDKAKTASEQMSDLAGSFTDLLDKAFGISDGIGAVQASMEALGAGLIDNGTSFTNWSEGGRANLENLQAAVGDVVDQNADMVKSGAETAEQATNNVADFVTRTLDQLANAGVDTSQLDFLVDYVNAIKAQPAIWSVSTDVSAGMSNLNALDNYAAQVQARIAGASVMLSSLGNVLPGKTADDQISTPSPYGVMPPSPPNPADALARGRLAAQQKADMEAAKAADDAANAAASERASSQKKAAGASREAAAADRQESKAAQDAAKKTQDAIDLANQKLEKHKQYIADVGSFYAKLGSAATENATGVGNVADALQKLGTSIATNGTSFNQFSEGGRANLDALSSSLDAYGATLQSKLNAGTITVGGAQAAFSRFAGGVRHDLLAAGVPLAQINAYFKSVGASGSFAGANKDIAQFGGLLQNAAKDAIAMGDAGTAATNKMGLSAKDLADYYSKVDDYFKSVTDNAFKFINAEGSVFAALQDLGQSVVDNGKSFNIMTESGRKNFTALGTVVSSFQTYMSQRISAGIITAKQGAAQLASFTGGIYAELLRMGVKASEIGPILKSLGLNPKGFNTNDKAVTQYAGVLTNAAAAARAAATDTSALGAAMAVAANYADRLSTALNSAFDKYNGLAQATDATATAHQGLSQHLADNVARTKELTAANKDLAAGVLTDQASVADLNKKIALATKYGQTDKAKALTAERDTAQAGLDDKQQQIKDNQAEIDRIKKYGNALTGNSKEAIANRAQYLALQKTMFDQIEAYAKTGASTDQVTKYTKNLAAEFAKAGREAGYSKGDIKKYTDQFTTYATTVRNTPKTITTTVQVNGITAAQQALGTLGSTGKYTITANADTTTARRTLGQVPTTGTYKVTASLANTATVTNTLSRIPKAGSYTVTAKVMGGYNSAPNVLRRAGLNGGGYAVSPSISSSKLNTMRNQIATSLRYASVTVNNAVAGVLGVLGISVGNKGVNTPNLTANQIRGNYMSKPVYTGGQITGFAGGGQFPGTPPSNPRQDNLLAAGPNGLYTVRSKEWVIQQPAVEYYGNPMMNAINNMTFPKMGYAGGGGISSGSISGGGDGTVRLSYEDRKLLMQAVNRPVVAAIDGQRLDTITANKQAAALRAGAN